MTIPLCCLVSHYNRFSQFTPLLVKCLQTVLSCIVIKTTNKYLAQIFVLQITEVHYSTASHNALYHRFSVKHNDSNNNTDKYLAYS